MAFIVPDLVLPTVYDIPLEFFTKRGIVLLFMDIDNTLVTYDDAVPTEENLKWLYMLKENGIETVFVSNNHEPRVAKYANACGFEYYADAGKPSCKVHKKVMKERGLLPSRCAGVGDQLFTDALAAHLAGGIAIKVDPIKDVTTLFNRFKRLCEKPFMRRYFKLHGGK